VNEPTCSASYSGPGGAALGRPDIRPPFRLVATESFSDIVERLEISKGSASQGLQLLRTLGAIRLVSKEGDRPDEQTVGKARDYYEPELSLRKLVSGVLQERIAPMTTTGSDHFALLRLLAEGAGKQNRFLIERVEQLETCRNRIRTVLPILSAWFGPKK